MDLTPTRPRVHVPRYADTSSGGTGHMMLAEYLSDDTGSDIQSPIVQMLARRVTAGLGNVIRFGVGSQIALRIPQVRKFSQSYTRTRKRRKTVSYSNKYSKLHWLRFPKRK